MLYRINDDLPAAVRKHLPDCVQTVYREAFNHAYAAHAGEIDREERSHMIAWAAVKRTYIKRGKDWAPRLEQ